MAQTLQLEMSTCGYINNRFRNESEFKYPYKVAIIQGSRILSCEKQKTSLRYSKNHRDDDQLFFFQCHLKSIKNFHFH